jgi:hypothetical protein
MRRFAFILITIIHSVLITGQVTQVSINDGLISREVHNAVIDDLGFLWIQTQNAVQRYDGHSFKTFSEISKDTFNLSNNQIYDIQKDDGGYINITYTLDPHTLDKIDTRNLSKSTLDFSIALEEEQKLIRVFPDESLGYVLLSHINGNLQIEILGFDGEKKTIEYEDSKLASDILNVKYFPGYNLLHIYFQDHLFVINIEGTEFRNIKWPNTVRNFSNDIRRFIAQPEKNGSIWLALNDIPGLFRVDPEGDIFTESEEFNQSHYYRGIAIDSKNVVMLMVGERPRFTDHLIYKDPDGKIEMRDDFLKYEEKIIDVFASDFSSRQIFLTHNGIFFYKKPKGLFTSIHHKIFAEDDIRQQFDDWGKVYYGVVESKDGMIYYLNEGLKVGKYNPIDQSYEDYYVFEGWMDEEKEEGLEGGVYDSLRNVYWIIYFNTERKGRLIQLNLANKKTKVYPYHNDFTCITLSPDHQVLLGSQRPDGKGDIVIFDPEVEQFNKINSAPDDLPSPVTFYLEGDNYWIGTSSGVYLSDSEFKEIKKVSFQQDGEEIEFNHDIRFIREYNNKFYLCTKGNGLSIADENRNIRKPVNNERLPNEDVVGIALGKDNHLWVSTYSGIFRINQNDSIVSVYMPNDGFIHHEFNTNSTLIASDSNIYFGSMDGILRINTDKCCTEIPYPLAISEFEIIDRNRKTSTFYSNDIKKIKLTDRSNNLRIRPIFLSLDSEEDVIYSYKLEEYDQDWRSKENYYPIEYFNIPPGNYELIIKAETRQGNQASNDISVDIQVYQPFYRNNIFWIITFSFFLISFIAYNSRKRVLVEKTKQREISKANEKIAMLELDALRAQMNPHFIFNSLGAIQYYIQLNETETADEYLSSFARLMRLFLESSKSNYIALDDEVDLLRNYTLLERARFDNKFTVEFLIDKNIDQHSMRVPTMLLQPFVENAINHGLYNKPGREGYLKIHFSKTEDESLICSIIDNGIGRAESKLIRKKQNKPHKSRATQIVEDRIVLINAKKEFYIHIDILDHYDKKGDPSGTEVIIEIKKLNDE